MNDPNRSYAGELAERIERALACKGIDAEDALGMGAFDWLVTSTTADVHHALAAFGILENVIVHLPTDPSSIDGYPDHDSPTLRLARARVAAIRDTLDGVCVG